MTIEGNALLLTILAQLYDRSALTKLTSQAEFTVGKRRGEGVFVPVQLMVELEIALTIVPIDAFYGDIVREDIDDLNDREVGGLFLAGSAERSPDRSTNSLKIWHLPRRK